MTDNSTMPFGKYSGKKMIDVPATYLKFIYENGYVTMHKFNRVYNYIKDNMDAIEKEIIESNNS